MSAGPPTELVLFVCTGNQCRSPLAEAMLRRQLGRAGCELEVRSAGTLGSGTPPPDEMAEVAAERGVDIAGRPSRPLDATELRAAALVVGMGRQHVVDVVEAAPEAWAHTFTFSELLRRAEGTGPRNDGESVGEWTARLGEGRQRADVLAAPSAEDVPDPMGRPMREYRRVADQIDAMTGRLAGLLCGTDPPPAAPPDPKPGRWLRRR